MTNFNRSSKSNPCPVCGRTKDADCRWYPDNLTVMCHTYVNGVTHDESKWHFTKATDDGLWGVFVARQESKTTRAKQTKDYYYTDRDRIPFVRVTRSDDGSGNKTFYQSHWDGSKWVKGCPKDIRGRIAVYRYAEVRAAIERGEVIFVVEGETTADALWGIGIPATTTIGGSGGYANYGKYSDDLKGARLILCPDRDANGVKYISNFEHDFSSQVEGYYLAGTESLWINPQGGMDIGDDIRDHGLTVGQILDKVISPETYGTIVSMPKAVVDSQPSHQVPPNPPLGGGNGGEKGEEGDLAEELRESIALKSGIAPNLFGGTLGDLLPIAAQNFNIPVSILHFCLLPILGSQIDSRVRLLINPGTNYKVPPIRWCGLVGDTGSKKSPILGLLTAPIGDQQNELYQTWKANKEEYDRELRSWKGAKKGEKGEEPEPPAPMRDLYFDTYTIEGITQSLSHYPDNGYLVSQDELAQFFGSLDMYRGGKGNDRQLWLKLWNGDGIKVNRKSADTIVVPQSSIGILGGIQPQTITNLLAGDSSDRDGLWNRFSFVGLPHNKTEAFTETPADLGEELGRVYRSLSAQKSDTHYFSPGAKDVWREWHDAIEDRTIAESHWLVKGTLAKFEGIAGRNALILHRAQAAIDGVKPTQQIPAATVKLAIEWTQWELDQTLSQYQLLGVDGTDADTARVIKFVDRFEGKGWVTARAVRNWWTGPGNTKPTADDCRQFMSRVVGLGYADSNAQSIDSPQYQIQISRVSVNGLNGLSDGLNGLSFSPFPEPLPTAKTQEDGLNGLRKIKKNENSSDGAIDPLIEIAQALEILARPDNPDGEALSDLGDFYQLWSAEEMRSASGILKTTNPTAYQRLLNLVKQYKAGG